MTEHTVRVRMTTPGAASDTRRYRACCIVQRALVLVLVTLAGFCMDSVWRDALLAGGVIVLYYSNELRDRCLRGAMKVERFYAVVEEIRSERPRERDVVGAIPPVPPLYN